MKLVRIRQAKALGNYRVQLTLTDGRVIERDIGPMLEGPVFSEIRNDEMRFMEFRVKAARWFGRRRRPVPGCPDLGWLAAGRYRCRRSVKLPGESSESHPRPERRQGIL